METKDKYKCFYCGKTYSEPLQVIVCQNSHEALIKKNNTDALNHYIRTELLNINDISNGMYTFGDLYNHKEVLFIAMLALLSKHQYPIWYTDTYSDGSRRPGSLLVGVFYEPEKQITYTVGELNRPYLRAIGTWLDKAPDFSGHTSIEVIDRIYRYVIHEMLLSRD